MKWLFTLLLLVNLVILGWGLQRDPDAAAVATRVSPGIGNLQLLSEVDGGLGGIASEQQTEQSLSDQAAVNSPTVLTAPSPASGVAQKQEEQETPIAEKLPAPAAPSAETESQQEQKLSESAPMVCGAFGPFERGAEARAIAESLVGEGMDASLRRESMEKPIGFWVLIPPLSSQEAAIEKVKQLRASGIEDIRRFVKGDLKDGISLGVFSRKANAQKRQQEITSKGHRADVVPRLITVPSYWIDYRSDQSRVDRAATRLRESQEGIKNEQYPCSRVVTSGGIF